MAARSDSGAGVRICAGGDVTLGTNLDTTWTTKMSEWLRRPVPALPNPDAVLRPLRPLVSDADIVLVNIETGVVETAIPTGAQG